MAEWEKQIFALNLIVGDLERSKAFYREVFERSRSPTIRLRAKICFSHSAISRLTQLRRPLMLF